MRKHLIRAKTLAALVTALLLAAPAAAIVAAPPPRTCSAYSSADVVVVGQVVSERVTDDWDTWTVRVEHLFKGRVPDRFKFYSENDSARATPDVGTRNILFLHRQRGRLIGWGSDPDTGGSRFDQVVREVRAFKATKPKLTGSVIGLVESEAGVPRASAQVRLRQSTNGAVRSVRTDNHGRFELSLPPGRWSATLADKGWASRSSIYTYENPDGFNVKAGGCDDLRLEPVKAG